MFFRINRRCFFAIFIVGSLWCGASLFAQIAAHAGGEPYFTFQVPQTEIGNPLSTAPRAINNSLTVVGFSSGLEPVGFLREASGQILTTASLHCVRTYMIAINDPGDAIGYCAPSGGFLRDRSGTITFLD